VSEIDLTGVNPIDYPELATWEWPVAAYLFVGGLVGGLMILSSIWRLRGNETWNRAIRIVDLWALPLLAIGLFLLFLDLSYKLHAWRFYTTFQPTSAMSWGAWILLTAVLLSVMRASIHVPSTTWFASGKVPAWSRRLSERLRSLAARRTRVLDVASVVVGASLAFYTGILLSTIPARPLWDSILLAPLFLVSGVAAAGAFACLFLSPEAHRKLTPVAMGLCLVELTLIAAFSVTLLSGTPATRNAFELLLSWPYGVIFWGVVVAAGLLVPFTIEAIELRRGSVPKPVGRAAPILKLVGSVGLRFVVVLAGLQTVM
jgi:formate-dependent nitrite reductase membrane component NrfD